MKPPKAYKTDKVAIYNEHIKKLQDEYSRVMIKYKCNLDDAIYIYHRLTKIKNPAKLARFVMSLNEKYIGVKVPNVIK